MSWTPSGSKGGRRKSGRDGVALGRHRNSHISATMAKLRGQHDAVGGPDAEQWCNTGKDICGN